MDMGMKGWITASAPRIQVWIMQGAVAQVALGQGAIVDMRVAVQVQMSPMGGMGRSRIAGERSGSG